MVSSNKHLQTDALTVVAGCLKGICPEKSPVPTIPFWLFCAQQ